MLEPMSEYTQIQSFVVRRGAGEEFRLQLERDGASRPIEQLATQIPADPRLSWRIYEYPWASIAHPSPPTIAYICKP